MANQKILDEKQTTINEISSKIKESSSIVWFEYHNLTVEETMELRKKLRETDSEYKVYKNTLVKRALDEIKINIDSELVGPKAIAFSKDAIAPIKVLADFAKKHDALQLKVGIIDGEVTDLETLKKLSAIPSRDGLLTQVASGLLGIVRDFAICLDLHGKNLEGGE